MQENKPTLNDWNPPLTLEGVKLPAWPEDIFPEPFNLFLKELSRSTETPIELASMLILSIIATTAQKKYEVQIKLDYREPLNIWTLGILSPASRKSRVYSEVVFPLKEWEFEQKNKIEPLVQIANSRKKTMEARLKEMRQRAAKAVDINKFNELQQQIENLERNTPPTPAYPQIWTGDVTPEQLGNIMSANSDAMAVLSDEGGIFDILNGLYSDGKANIDLFLQSHAASSLRIDRGSRPPILMQRPVLTMGLTIQPQVIKTICRNKTFRGRGLLGRFLYVIPKSNIGSRSLEEPSMQVEVSHDYRNAVKAILNSKFDDNKHILILSPEAYYKWQKYAKFVERMMDEEIGHLSHIMDWAGKLPGAIARIAGLLHIMRYAHQSPENHQISLIEMSSAIKIGHVLINHALMVFDLLQEDNEEEVALTIFNWLKRDKVVQFTHRECLRKFRRFKKNELKPALEKLKEHEILREKETKPTLGRPSGLFEVNPLLFN
jgi:hypothetical protein